MNKKDEEDENIEVDDDENDEYLIVKEAIKITDGEHTGLIENVVHERRGKDNQYNYIDIYVLTPNESGEDVTIKTGFPAYVTENSGLGTLLEKSKYDFSVGDKIDYETIKQQLVGKKISFTTYTEDKFARIVNKTIGFI